MKCRGRNKDGAIRKRCALVHTVFIPKSTKKSNSFSGVLKKYHKAYLAKLFLFLVGFSIFIVYTIQALKRYCSCDFDESETTVPEKPYYYSVPKRRCAEFGA